MKIRLVDAISYLTWNWVARKTKQEEEKCSRRRKMRHLFDVVSCPVLFRKHNPQPQTKE
jgi:hypothetical protein